MRSEYAKQVSRFVCLTGCLALLPPAADAHHSFAPHFDADQTIELSGTITEFEARNPHAYLHVSAADASGETHVYVCESHGVTQLERNGIDRTRLTPGTHVSLEGARHRRDPYGCFFQSIKIEDGPWQSVNGPARTRPGQPAVAAATETGNGIFGKWLLQPANRSTSGNDDMMDHLTEAGRRATAAYDPFVDDPTFQCDPVAIRRVWFAPSTPLEIRREGDRVILHHEWMDVERVVYLDLNEHPSDGPRTSLGHSIGRFDDEGRLIIDTANYSEGVLRQYVERPDGTTLGMLHSADLRTTEVLSYDEQTQSLEVTIHFEDPVYYTQEFPPVSARYGRTNLEIQPFGCIAELHD